MTTASLPGEVERQAVAAPAELNGMLLLSDVLRARVARWFGRFSSGKDGAA